MSGFRKKMHEFKAEKKAEYTEIALYSREKKAGIYFSIFLFVQAIVVYFTLHKVLITSFIISVAILSLILPLIKKRLLLTNTQLILKYSLFGITLYKRSIEWNLINKVIVEINKVIKYDLIVQFEKKVLVIQRSLSEEGADKLLQELQTFHHYIVRKK